ncbi:MAG: malic enzyme, partial [Burkholderia sp.]|nr:malic enzyme [Burkholderia sp.]
QFGKAYIVPTLLDPRLLTGITPKIAAAAYASGVARKQLDEAQYKAQLEVLGKTLI